MVLIILEECLPIRTRNNSFHLVCHMCARTVNVSTYFERFAFFTLPLSTNCCSLPTVIVPALALFSRPPIRSHLITLVSVWMFLFKRAFFLSLSGSMRCQASTIDGRRKGACLFCQEYFMDLYLLAEMKTISLKVTTVDMLKPPPDFR